MTDFHQDHNNIRDVFMDKNPPEKIRQGENAIPKLIGSVGAVALVLGLIIIAVSDKTSIFTLGLSGLGLLLIVVFVAIDFKNVKSFLSMRETIYTTNLTLVLLALFGILVVINAFSANHYIAIDLTKNKDNTLSGQTRNILDDINGTNRKIEITAFIKSNDERRFVIIALLDNYRHFAPGLNFKLVDYEIKKKLAIERGIDRSCILVESDGASQKAWEFDERNITSALLKLLHPDQKVIGTMIGHGEFNPQGSGGRSISQLVDYLEKENFVVKPIDISSSGTIPAEISLVIIVGPQRPFHEKDIAALKEFSSRGGSIALFLEPFSKHGLDNYLAELGLTDSQDMIIDKTENYFKEETTPVVKIYMDHPITAGFMAMQTAEGSYVEGIIMPTATSLKINSKASLDYTVQPLALTSEGSWGETNSQTMEYTPQKDNPGPLVVAAVGSRTYPSDEESESVTSHVLVVGDADFITDANLKEGSNFDFAINSLDWLAQKENLMGEHIKIAVDRRIDLEPAQMKAVQIVNFMLPMFIAGIGLFMWLKRR